MYRNSLKVNFSQGVQNVLRTSFAKKNKLNNTIQAHNFFVFSLSKPKSCHTNALKIEHKNQFVSYIVLKNSNIHTMKLIWRYGKYN
jgi:hypothetical protein